MAFKVLLGLLAAVGVTGGAVYYGTGSGHCSGGGCPLSAMAATCPADDESAAEPASCCAAKSKANMVCCAEGEQVVAAGDAMAALTGGVTLGR